MVHGGDTGVSSDCLGKIDKVTDKAFFYRDSVYMGCEKGIKIKLETLIGAKCDLSSDWYKSVGLHKSMASRIKNGLIIPNREWRIKIANYFGVDSATIWDVDFQTWCDMHDAIENLWDKIGGIKNG